MSSAFTLPPRFSVIKIIYVGKPVLTAKTRYAYGVFALGRYFFVCFGLNNVRNMVIQSFKTVNLISRDLQ